MLKVNNLESKAKAYVHVLCGPVGSGKTTFAKKLERFNVIRFSVDEWMLSLFGEHMPRELFDARLLACQNLILDLSKDLIQKNVAVALDFGLWKPKDRKHIIMYLNKHGLPFKFYLLHADKTVLWQRLEKRNQNLPAGTFEISKEMFELFFSWFQPPTPSEGFEIISVTAKHA